MFSVYEICVLCDTDTLIKLTVGRGVTLSFNWRQ